MIYKPGCQGPERGRRRCGRERIDRVPREIIHDHVRLTLQPFDAPGDAKIVSRVIEHLGSDDILLFSTDYPHWHFDGSEVLPDGLSGETVRKLMIDNPLATYARLRDDAQANA